MFSLFFGLSTSGTVLDFCAVVIVLCCCGVLLWLIFCFLFVFLYVQVAGCGWIFGMWKSSYISVCFCVVDDIIVFCDLFSICVCRSLGVGVRRSDHLMPNKKDCSPF